MVAAKNWRRFRCSWTNRKWPKLIPDCDSSAVNWNFTWNDVEVLGLSLFPFLKVSRYVDPASRIDITECHSRLRWLQNYDIPCSPLQSRSFTSIQMIHTHTPGRSRVNPERQEGEKRGHKRRAKGRNSAGGKGTNGPPEPAYTAGTSTEHTPKPHDTLQRGRGEN